MILLVGFGIRTFYDPPDQPSGGEPFLLRDGESAEGDGQLRVEWDRFVEKRRTYRRNVFLVAPILGIVG